MRFHTQLIVALLSIGISRAPMAQVPQGSRSAGSAQTPRTFEEIPLYTGATRDPAAAITSGAARNSAEGRAFIVNAPIEAVVKFYAEHLAARDMTDSASDAFDEQERRLRPGESTPILLHIEPVDFENDSAGRAPDELRAAYRKARPPYREDQWLSTASLKWTRATPDGRDVFVVDLADIGAVPAGGDAMRNATRIALRLKKEWAAGSIKAVVSTPLVKGRLPEPSPAQLGVPKYPGARYDAVLSGEMSSDSVKYYVYATGDAPSTVTAYYERATGVKAQALPAATTLIAVKGNAPSPELGVKIEPRQPLYPAWVNAVITVQQAKR